MANARYFRTIDSCLGSRHGLFGSTKTVQADAHVSLDAILQPYNLHYGAFLCPWVSFSGNMTTNFPQLGQLLCHLHLVSPNLGWTSS